MKKEVYMEFLYHNARVVKLTITNDKFKLITLDQAIVSLNLPIENQRAWYIINEWKVS